MSDDPKVAQPRSTMFERNIGHAASRGREIRIIQKVGETVTGFIGGLDEEYLQVCNTHDQTLETINRENIASWKETGNTLNTFERDSVMSPEDLKKIRDRVDHFMKKMAYAFQKKQR